MSTIAKLYTPNVIRELRQALAERRCVFLAGPEFSMKRSEIRNNLVDRNGIEFSPKDRRKVDHDMARSNFGNADDMIKKYLKRLSPDAKQSVLRRALSVNSEKVVQRIHSQIVQMKFRGILSIAHDLVLETAYAMEKRKPIAKFYPQTMQGMYEEYQGNRPFLLKLFGDIDHPHSLIVDPTSTQFRNKPEYKLLEEIASETTILSIGMQGYERTRILDLLCEAQQGGEDCKHFMLVQSHTVTSNQADELEKKGITIVEYEEKEMALVEFLRELTKPHVADAEDALYAMEGVEEAEFMTGTERVVIETPESVFQSCVDQMLALVPKGQEPPSCFISYAWGEPVHEKWVRDKLTPDLRRGGINVILDRDTNRSGDSVLRFVEKNLPSADYVMVVGSHSYRQKHDRESGVVHLEMELIGLRFTKGKADTVIPIVLQGTPEESLPGSLQGRSYEDFTDGNRYFEGVFEVLIKMHDLSKETDVVRDICARINSTAEAK